MRFFSVSIYYLFDARHFCKDSDDNCTWLFTSQSFFLCQPLNGRVLVRVQKLTKLRLLEPPGSDPCTVEGSLFSWCLDCPKEKDMGQMATFMTTVPTLVTSTNATARCLKVKSQLFPVKPRIAWHLLRMMIAKFTACFL